MKRLASCFLVALAVALGANPAVGQTTATLDVRVEQGPPAELSEGFVNLVVTITERGTGQPPSDDYAVYAFAQNAAGEKSIIYPCGEVRDNDPQAPPGVYACTVIVDYGGQWNFVAVVNQEQVDRNQPPVTLGQGNAQFEVSGGAGKAPADQETLSASTTDAVMLWGHSVAAAAWFACIALLVVVALPAFRRALSPRGLHRLEERLDLIGRATGAVTAVTIGSGTFLLLNQTAYETPFSPSDIESTFDLPYAKPYFVSLGVKLGLYALMVLASASLVREAFRQRRSSFATQGRAAQPRRGAPVRRAAIWTSAPGSTPQPQTSGRTLLATAAESPAEAEAPVDIGEAPPETERPAPVSVRLGLVVILVGAIGIWLCVTLLKYFHELVEAVP